MNYIVVSRFEEFLSGAQKIEQGAKNANKECTIVDIENLLDETVVLQIKAKQSIIYFLTNDLSIPKYCKVLNEIGTRIINFDLLSSHPPKYELQKKVSSCGVLVPKSTYPIPDNIDATSEIQFPLYIKSQKQASEVFYVKNNIEFEKIIKSLIDIKNYYIEQAIDENRYVLEKIYYIDGNIILLNHNTEQDIKWLLDILNIISKSLGLEVFSVDIFLDLKNKNYYCIDINPASSFFKRDDARAEFIKKLLI